MNQLTLAALLSALAMGAAAQAPEAVRIPGAASRITLPDHPYRMSEGDLYSYKGVYDLSNGKTLRLFGRGFNLYAEVEDEGPHRLLATAANAFVAADRQLKLRLDLHDDGTVAGELTMVVPAGQVAGVPTAETLVVAQLR